MKTILILTFVVIALLNIYSQKNNNQNDELKRYIKLFTKPLLIPLLIAIYMFHASKVNTYLLMALLFGWIGDLVLLTPHCKKPDTKKRSSHMKPLSIALLFFFCGHIMYFLLFAKSSIKLMNENIIYLLIYIAYISYGIVIFLYLSKNGLLSVDNKTLSSRLITLLRMLIIIYMIAFSLMGYTSLLRLINLKSISAVLTFIGSIIFISSDSVLGLKRFGQKLNLSEQYIMGSYITAQSLIVIGYII